ncbi:MAG: dihydrodipicolinate synthase family protein [Chloroflexi bacterium]|nr:dihydrodipicolinate synthase family protein [Chloroflexota bacterium]
MQLDGIIVPLVTPLQADETLDEPGLEKLVEHVIAGGVSGIFLLGSSGEGPALSDAVKERLVRLVSAQAKNRVAVLVGAFAVGTRQTIELARRLLKHGGDCAVLVAPFYFSQTQDEIATHIATVARALDGPTMCYNIPQMVKTIIEPETAAKIAQTEHVIAIKDSWGDMARFQRTLAIKYMRPDFGVYQGAEAVAALSISRGANGAVLGLANVAPKLCVDLYLAAKSDELARAWKLQEQLMVLWQLHTHGQWLPCLKMAVSQLGICEPTVTAPFTAITPDAIAAIKSDMQAAKILSKLENAVS